MFSFMLWVAKIFSKGKEVYGKQVEHYKKKSNDLKEKARQSIKTTNKGAEKQDTNNLADSDSIDPQRNKSYNLKHIKGKITNYIILAVAFLETLPVFLNLLLIVLLFVCVMTVVVVIFSFLATVNSIIEQDESFVHDGNVTSPNICGPDSFTGGVLEWTDAELASRGATLTDYEKNIYRLGILARNTVTGVYGKPYYKVKDEVLSTKMLLGVASIESAMVFHSDGQNRSIFDIPSNQPLNSSGYGFFGLSPKTDPLSKIDQNVVNKINSMYTPKSPYSYEAQYVPYAVVLSANHLQGKESAVKTGHRNAGNILNRVLDDWGIHANRAELEGIIEHFLIQAQYHGADAFNGEYEAYYNMWAAMFHATSDIDAERTFSKWSLQDNGAKNSYGESGFRKAVIGAETYGQLYKYTSATQLKKADVSTIILLNGKPIDKPLWGFLAERYDNHKGFQQAWTKVKDFSYKATGGGAHKETGGGVGARVLNFHYGLNSYLQSNRVEQSLAKKMDIVGTNQTTVNCNPEKDRVVPGNYRETPGKGQSFIDDIPIEDWMNNWITNNPGNIANHIKKLQKHWGESKHLSDPKSVPRKNKYEDKVHGVPFYGQGSNFKETYGEIQWHPNTSHTYNRSGCMIYSHAYAASALTGCLINPAEMGSIMLATNSLISGGVAGASMPNTYAKMGLNAKFINVARNAWGDASKPTRVGQDIATTVKNGGVAVARFTGKPFSSGYNHYVVITSVETKNGKDYYTLYSSYSTKQSTTVYSKEYLLANGNHRDVVLVWK